MYKKLVTYTIFALFASACSKSATDGGTPAVGRCTVEAHALPGESDVAAGMNFAWRQGDAIALFDDASPRTSNALFLLETGQESDTGVFGGVFVDMSACSRTVYGIYPYGGGVETGGAGRYTFTLPTVQTGNASTGAGGYCYMVATPATLSASPSQSVVNLDFNPLTTRLDIEVTNTPPGAAVTSVVIRTPAAKSFATRATVDYTAQAGSPSFLALTGQTAFSDSLRLTVTGAPATGMVGSIAAFPFELANTPVEIVVTTNDLEYTFELPPVTASYACGASTRLTLDISSATSSRPVDQVVRSPRAGLVWFPGYDGQTNFSAVGNPYIGAALMSIYWSQLEPVEGEFHWEIFDEYYNRWVGAGKKIALRVHWATSGYWANPVCKTPTPKWVWDKGARYIYHAPSKTEVPIVWDPIYEFYAKKLLKAINDHYALDPNILTVDITPGGETNPFRMDIANRDLSFTDYFIANAVASDGRPYSNAMWLAEVKEWISFTRDIMIGIPCSVALNAGGLGTGVNNFKEIGDWAVANGMSPQQNGLKESGFAVGTQRLQWFQTWGLSQHPHLEAVGASDNDPTGNGTLLGMMKAAERAGAYYVNIYAADVLKGTRGLSGFDQSYEDALIYGVNYMSKLP